MWTIAFADRRALPPLPELSRKAGKCSPSPTSPPPTSLCLSIEFFNLLDQHDTNRPIACRSGPCPGYANDRQNQRFGRVCLTGFFLPTLCVRSPQPKNLNPRRSF